MKPPSSFTPRPPWQPPSLAELQSLLPAYEFHALIGRGGMGAVFKATQRSLNRPVAIKVLPAKLLADEDANFAARFRQEALTMAKLTHPGIVSVFESGEAGGLLYIVMEFVDGTDVAKMIAGKGKLAPEVATRLLTQVCDALHYAHERGVVHRDIKPANLLVTRDGTVKIADFGLAKHDDAALLGLTKTNVANVRIFWALPATGFVLDQTMALTAPPASISWSQVSVATYQTNATHISITVTPGIGSKFYRLRHP